MKRLWKVKVEGEKAFIGKIEYSSKKLNIGKGVYLTLAVPVAFISIVYLFAAPIAGVLAILLDIYLFMMSFKCRKALRLLREEESKKTTIEVQKKETGVFSNSYEHQDMSYPKCLEGNWLSKYDYKEVKIKPEYIISKDGLSVGQTITINIEEKQLENNEVDYYLVLSQFDFVFAEIPVLKERVAAMIKNYLNKDDWKVLGNLSTIDEDMLYYHVAFYENIGDEKIHELENSGTVVMLENTDKGTNARVGMKVRAAALFGGEEMLVTDLSDNKIGYVGGEITQQIIDAGKGREAYGIIEQVVLGTVSDKITVRFDVETAE